MTQEKTFDLGYERTRMAADRTLMAWIRTSVSMISFGFTIYKFFQYLRESDALTRELPHFGARNLGLTLVAIGTFLMGIALVEHIIYMRSLSRWANQKFSLSLTLIAALFISVLGLLALLNLLLNIGPI
jgi:putative membrane protein